ncbi:MAG: GNAT family N-acetyltransferase [Bacteroidales bacterium]|nr:GNAT family N-acetyltransferase [Bacteroidales bacterium]
MFTFSALTVDDCSKVLALEEAVILTLENHDFLRHNTPEMWQRCLQPPHAALGAWEGQRLVALAVLYCPEPGEPDHLAQYLPDPALRQLPSANYKICMVHPDGRGHGLQQLLGQKLEVEAKQRGCRLLCATAAPQNLASTHSLEKLGYKLSHTMEKYGALRGLYWKRV